MAGRTTSPGQSVTSRVLAILDTFDISHTNQSLSDIARRAGLPVATAYRLVGELVAWRGLARRDDGRYEIGVRLWEVGLVGPLHLRLWEVAPAGPSPPSVPSCTASASIRESSPR